MAAKTATPSVTKTKPTLTKKEAKALEKSTASSSAPWNKPSLHELQVVNLKKSSNSLPVSSFPISKPDLKPIQSLTECLQLLHKLAEEVNNISQVKRGSKNAAPEGSSKEPESLESSRTLILHWAKELERNMVKKKTKPKDEKARRQDDPGRKEKTKPEEQNEKLQRWALELMNIKDANSVSDEELKKLLYPRGEKQSKMAAILPLLEFVVWSLLSQDTEEEVSMLWLPTKQKAWRTATGSPRYIPNSVWQWIQSASVSVRLDASTSHPWLAVSSDHLQVQEAQVRSSALSDNSQRFTAWPCILGDTIITTGRHYWEVEVSSEGSWRIGVMSESAFRKNKITMSPKTGFWALWKASRLWACTDNPTKLQRAAVPRLIGVYVDVREGQVSFYDVDQRVHIYTFSDTFNQSLIPLFGCFDGDTVLKVIPAEKSITTEDQYMYEYE
ncbi:hypothetical protein PAMP_015396 [Pampus punctatissimus]